MFVSTQMFKKYEINIRPENFLEIKHDQTARNNRQLIMTNSQNDPDSSDYKIAHEDDEPKAREATALLRADHKLVSILFAEYENALLKIKKKQLVAQICTELTIHAQVEEEIFYPAVKKALNDGELVPEAIVEHATLKALIAEVEGKEPVGEMFEAKIKVLSEYVKHHVKEEQEQMFPKARATQLDMIDLGKKIEQRKAELLIERI